MSDALDKLLVRVAEEVFEGVAFMIRLPEDEAPEVGTEIRVASVSFEGAFQGRLVSSVCDQMLSTLATNMLGLEDGPDPTPAEENDALKELTNVACGHLLSAIAGPQADFRVGAPELSGSDFPGRPAPGQNQVAQARIILDSGQAKLALFADDKMPTVEVTLSGDQPVGNMS